MTHPKTGSWNILDRIKTQTLVLLILHIAIFMGFLRGSDGKEFACNAGNPGAISGSGRSPGKGHGNSLQYSCLENSMDRGAWQAIVHGGRIESDMTEWLTYKHTHTYTLLSLGFLSSTVVKNLPANAGNARDSGSVLGTGRPPGEGNGNPLQYSCLKNPMDRRTWQAAVPRVPKSQTQLSDWSHTYIVIFNWTQMFPYI